MSASEDAGSGPVELRILRVTAEDPAQERPVDREQGVYTVQLALSRELTREEAAVAKEVLDNRRSNVYGSTLRISGTTLEWIAAHQAELVEQVRTIAGRGEEIRLRDEESRKSVERELAAESARLAAESARRAALAAEIKFD
jgi:hypothetical protein